MSAAKDKSEDDTENVDMEDLPEEPKKKKSKRRRKGRCEEVTKEDVEHFT